MMKIRAVTMFVIAQAVLAKQHASRRSPNTAVEDRAIGCDRNVVAKKFVQQESGMKGRLCFALIPAHRVVPNDSSTLAP